MCVSGNPPAHDRKAVMHGVTLEKSVSDRRPPNHVWTGQVEARRRPNQLSRRAYAVAEGEELIVGGRVRFLWEALVVGMKGRAIQLWGRRVLCAAVKEYAPASYLWRQFWF